MAAAMPAELARPLSVVDAIFERQCQGQAKAGGDPEKPLPKSWGERDHFVQALGLQDEEAFARIPCLNDVELAEGVPPFSLVRYRGLVQDVFEPEIYTAFVQELPAEQAASPAGLPAPQPAGRVLTTKYRESVTATPGSVLREYGGFSSRGACFMVPLPAETAWARASAAEWSRPGSAALGGRASVGTPNRNKRSLSDNDAEMEMEMTPPPAPHPQAPRRQRQAGAAPAGVGPRAAATARASDDFGLNLPLPCEEGRGSGFQPPCIVKLYDDLAEAVKICECVEVVGVLCVDPSLANFDSLPEEWPLGSDARQPSTSMVPRLHAVLMRRLPFHSPLLPFSPDWLSEARLAVAYQRRLGAPEVLAAARGAAIAELARRLGGDEVAAEYLLMLMVSRAFGHSGEQSLGGWSMNIVGWPDDAGAAELAAAVGELVPRCAHLQMSVDSLNNQRWRPRKDFEANRLVAGQLQLAPGTVLVLDEMGMAGGQLTADGVRNLTAIGTLLTEQSLTCDFFHYDVKIPLELHCIAVSRKRSIVKDVHVVLPLQPSPQAAAALQPAPTEALDAARFLIGLVTRQPRPLSIPSEVSAQISNDFVQARQQFCVQSGLPHTWMGLARASCLLQGEQALTLERWQRVLLLERERLTRCGRLGLLTPAA